ncbi:MAG: hypothetical protein ACOCY0_00480 [Roseicyclus sp.]
MIPIIRTLSAAGLALGLALGAVTATATPARANNNNEAVAIIGGLIALYAIGQAIKHNDGRAEAQVIRPKPPSGHQPHRPHRPQRLVAPARCFIDGHDAGGYFRGYLRHCMQKTAARPDLLPPRCLRRVETHRGPRMIYAGPCLARNGWVREAGFRP